MTLPETSRWNPVGNQPHSVELANNRKRVLRGRRRRRLRSVDSDGVEPCY